MLAFYKRVEKNGQEVAIETKEHTSLLALSFERDENISKQNKMKQNKNLFESTREARVLRGDLGFR